MKMITKINNKMEECSNKFIDTKMGKKTGSQDSIFRFVFLIFSSARIKRGEIKCYTVESIR